MVRELLSKNRYFCVTPRMLVWYVTLERRPKTFDLISFDLFFVYSVRSESSNKRVRKWTLTSDERSLPNVTPESRRKNYSWFCPLNYVVSLSRSRCYNDFVYTMTVDTLYSPVLFIYLLLISFGYYKVHWWLLRIVVFRRIRWFRSIANQEKRESRPFSYSVVSTPRSGRFVFFFFFLSENVDKCSTYARGTAVRQFRYSRHASVPQRVYMYNDE